jgi:hypothetical protein
MASDTLTAVESTRRWRQTLPTTSQRQGSCSAGLGKRDCVKTKAKGNIVPVGKKNKNNNINNKSAEINAWMKNDMTWKQGTDKTKRTN